MKKFIGTTAAFGIGIVSIFAFKAPAKPNLKDSQIRWSYNNKTHTQSNCTQVTCTNFNTHVACGVGDVIYSNSTCGTQELDYIYKP